MTSQPCPQLNLVEALHDGRLGPNEQASCERHMRTCAVCTARQHALREIRDAVRSAVAEPTQLEHQRARLALLRAAVAPPRRAAPRRQWLLAAGLLFAASAMAGVAAWQTFSPPRQTNPASIAAPAVDVAEPDAPKAAHRRQEAPHAPVPVPEEPVVAQDVTPATVEAPAAEIAAKPHRAANKHHAKRARPHSDASGAAKPHTVGVESTAAAEPPNTSPASADFAAAMAALGGRDFSVAASRFKSFAASYPNDPRSDEASYLTVIALQRAGRVEDAQTAAQRYLRDHPHGARRGQAMKIAGPEPL